MTADERRRLSVAIAGRLRDKRRSWHPLIGPWEVDTVLAEIELMHAEYQAEAEQRHRAVRDAEHAPWP